MTQTLENVYILIFVGGAGSKPAPSSRSPSFHLSLAMSKNLRLSGDTLAALKEQHDFSSYDAVIANLVEEAQNDPKEFADDADEELDSGQDSGSSNDPDGPPLKKRNINVRDALYSLQAVAERDGMLESHTGFTLPQFQVLLRCVEEVIHLVHFWCFLCFFSFRPPACVPSSARRIAKNVEA